MQDFINKLISITPLSESSQSLLLDFAVNTDVRKKDFLLKEGERCNAIYFVSKGLFKSFYNIDGKEINTSFYFENDFVTNIRSLQEGCTSEYSIKALEHSTVVRLDKLQMIRCYSQSHEIETLGRKVLEMIIAAQEQHANSFKLLTPGQRFENLVSQHPRFLQKVSLTEIASYLGMSRETLSRIRRRK